MPDYQQGKIYGIESASAGLIYYGSTINTLAKRLGQHKATSSKTMARLVLAHPDARIILVENFPCNSKAELTAREAKWIRENSCVNKILPGRTKTQYYQDNREALLAQKKQYRKREKEAISTKKQKILPKQLRSY